MLFALPEVLLRSSDLLFFHFRRLFPFLSVATAVLDSFSLFYLPNRLKHYSERTMEAGSNTVVVQLLPGGQLGLTGSPPEKVWKDGTDLASSAIACGPEVYINTGG